MPTANPSIAESTPLLPVIVAETTLERLAQFRGVILSEKARNRLSVSLAERADLEFRTNHEFSKKILSQAGREWLNAFYEYIVQSERLLKSA